MTSEEYQRTLHELQAVAMVIQVMDLAGFLESIAIAESVGPLLDPQLYMQGSKPLNDVRRIAEAVYDCQRRIRETVDGWTQEFLDKEWAREGGSGGGGS